MADAPGMDYRSAGVDLDAAERSKTALKALVAATRDVHTLSELGSFGGLYAVPGDTLAPVLVSSADGVGTKLKIAFEAGRHGTVGQDLVNHCVNDILVQGARPLFFLDYLACGPVPESTITEVVRGVAEACLENGCALLGGETAQMPDFYAAGEYDLAGFIVGVVERSKIVDGSRIRPGDVLIGLPSSGLHTNGYTLARKIVSERMGLSAHDPFPGEGGTVADVLLRVHRSYLPSVWPTLERNLVRGLAHITGGGIPGNLPRILPEGCGAVISASSWEVPATFRTLQRAGGVDEDEMRRVFNMGVGMIVVCAPEDEAAVSALLEAAGEAPWRLGAIEAGEGVRYEG